jgi:hypothetical protein
MSAEHSGHRLDWFDHTPIHSNYTANISPPLVVFHFLHDELPLAALSLTHAKLMPTYSYDRPIPQCHQADHTSFRIGIIMTILLDSNGDFNRLIGVIPHFILPIHLSLVCSESRRLARIHG